MERPQQLIVLKAQYGQFVFAPFIIKICEIKLINVDKHLCSIFKESVESLQNQILVRLTKNSTPVTPLGLLVNYTPAARNTLNSHSKPRMRHLDEKE